MVDRVVKRRRAEDHRNRVGLALLVEELEPCRERPLRDGERVLRDPDLAPDERLLGADPDGLFLKAAEAAPGVRNLRLERVEIEECAVGAALERGALLLQLRHPGGRVGAATGRYREEEPGGQREGRNAPAEARRDAAHGG